VSEEPQAERWIVLLAHGSQDSRWRQPFEQLRQLIAECASTGIGVALGYLQFCEPTLGQCLETCRQQGADQVVVVPAFMSGGGHLLRDVPGKVAEAASAVPGLKVHTTGALAEEPEVMEAMVRAVLRLASG
jgi:sirohydrochlorin cobaltochelatase